MHRQTRTPVRPAPAVPRPPASAALPDPSKLALRRAMEARKAPELTEMRDAFLAELGQVLDARWPAHLAAEHAGLFASAARAVLDLHTRRLGERVAAELREHLVGAWQFLAQLERLRVAIEDDLPEGEIARIARTVLGR